MKQPGDNPGTVFIVDDDDSVRRSLARLIRACGHAVETFPSGEEFLASLKPEELASDFEAEGRKELEEGLAKKQATPTTTPEPEPSPESKTVKKKSKKQ